MATPDKVEAVSRVTETLSKQSNVAEEMERLAPNKEHFDSLMSSFPSVKPASFERIETKVVGVEEAHAIEIQPAFGEENLSAQKSGTATDQERKRGRQGGQEEDQVGSISAARSQSSPSATTSLMDEVSKLNKNVSSVSNLPVEGIKGQAQEVIAQLEKVKTQLSQTQGQIKPSYQTLLKNRLAHIDDNLKIALNKAGVEYTPPTAGSDVSSNAIHKFLGLLTNSQNQMANLHGAIDQFNVTGQISPANMLAIQMKVGYIQQQIELFTSLLNKALESTKTIMNVQV